MFTTILTASRALLKDANRLDQVLELLITINRPFLRLGLQRLERVPEGRELLRDRPLINRKSVDFDALAALPDGTFGREYVRFLQDHGITPEPFEVEPPVDDPDLAYLVMRMRQTHDLWHVLTGYGADVEGELLLQAFFFAQTSAPGALALLALGSVRYMRGRPGYTTRLHHAYRRGKATHWLPPVRWERLWERSVDEARAELHCPS